MEVKIKLINPQASIPAYANFGDAGLDLLALEDYELKPGERKIFFVGFALEFPPGYVALVKDKGSLPKNGGIHTMGGVFDSGYRGEYNVNLINLGTESYQIKTGHKIAQLIILPCVQAKLVEDPDLTASQRGEGRFGSSGK
ncbi:MAG: dUTP diphosphatase [Patescibacteria group bacterium]|jgi:dUTP pyrophosphatase|nr:dUTP diphosphatase [Patescibacteria group bacterium]